MTDKEADELYKALSSEYTIVSSRTDTLTGRAQSLLVFGSIVNAILVAIVMAAAASAASTFLTQYANYLPLLRIVILGGFAFYVASVLLSLVAYITGQYFPIPQFNREFLYANISGKAKFRKQAFLLPIMDAIEFHQGQNNKKWWCLFAGTISMLIAVIFTAFLGILLFLAIV